MTHIIGIATTIIYIAQLIISIDKDKFNEFPFIEYEDIQSKHVSKLATFLWKTIFFLVFGIILLVLICGMFVFRDLEDYQILFKKLYLTNIFIIIASGGIKDIFHNVILYKDWFVVFFKNHSPTKEFLRNIAGVNIVILLLTSCAGALSQDTNIIWVCDIILMCVLAMSFCLYRAIAEAEDLIYIHKVMCIKIKMSDGKEYDKINYYHEDKKIVCIGVAGEDARYYLNKEQIVYIEKRMSKKVMMDVLLDKLKK